MQDRQANKPYSFGNKGHYTDGTSKIIVYGIVDETVKTVALAREYFANNKVSLVYKLEKPTYEEITDPALVTYLDTTHISTNSTIPCNMKLTNSGYNAIIKPSTQYTVAFDTDKSGEVNIGLGGAKTSTPNGIATITTPSTLTDDVLRLYGKGIKASNVRLLEGDKTNYIPSYFEGMKSCFEDKEQDNGSYEVEIISSNSNNNKSNKIQFSSIEPLRAVGDVKDRFVLKDGKLMIERNCGEIVLDGNTNGITYMRGYDGAKDTDTNMLFSMRASKEVLPIAGKNGECSSGICNILPNIYTADVLTKDAPIGFSLRPYHSQNNYYINIRMNKNRMISNDINGIKDWLNKNNLIIEFPTIEPVYEEIPYEKQKLILVCYENGTLFIDTLIPPTVSVTYSANIPVISALNEQTVIQDQQDAMILENTVAIAMMNLME